MKAAAAKIQLRSPAEAGRTPCAGACLSGCASRAQQPCARAPLVQPAGSSPALPPESDDRFHLNCVVAQVWLVQLRRYTETRYALAAEARHSALQNGYARRSFSALFEPPSAIEAVRLFENLLRFANYENAVPARTFFLAYAPLVFEHDLSGEYIGPGVWRPEAGLKDAGARVRRTLQRWCDWLEALIHFQVHELHRPQNPRRDMDQAIILIWPLVIRHHWNGQDLLSVLRGRLDCAAAFPCQSEAQLGSYCRAVLGLRLPNRHLAAGKGELPGQAVAERLFRFLPAID